FKELISDLKTDEAFYIAALGGATASLASKTTALITQTAKAANASGSYGFSAGLELQGTLNKEETSSSITKSVATNINTNNFTLKANNKASIQGSNINANTGDINAEEVNILASQDTSNSQSDSKSIEVTVGISTAGVDNVEGSISGSKSNSQSTTNNNAKLNFNNLQITSSEDTNILGANLNAQDTLALNVGGSLDIQSLQNTKRSSSDSASIGSNTSASLSKSKEKTTVLSSLSAGSIDIDVQNNTNLKGALISATQEDTLNIDTKTLTTSNLSNTKNSRNISLGGSIGSRVSGNLALGSTNTKSKTLATITAGNINLANTQESSDISKLNRNKEDVNLNLYDVKSDVSVSAELDTRLLSKDGRKQIKDEIKVSSKITDTVVKIVTTKDVKITNFFSQTDKSVKQYKAFNEVLKKNPELANKLADENLPLEEKQKYQNQFKVALEEKLGYKIANTVKTISTKEKGQGKEDISGFISNENDTIYSNDKNQKSTEDTIRTLGQELAAGIQKAEGIDITTNRIQHNNYQDMIAQDAVDDIAFSLANNYGTSMATSNTNNQAIVNPSVFNLSANNKEFKGLDKEKGDNSIYLYKNKVVATDRIDNDKVVDLSTKDKDKVEDKTISKYQIDDDTVFKDTVAIVGKDTINNISKESKIYDLNSIEDFVTLQRRTEMNYNNINKDTTIVFQNGMGNTYEEAKVTQAKIQAKYPKDKVGLINNETGTFSYISDFMEWQDDALTTKDVLNAYIYKQLSPNTLLETHSAGNEDNYKANKINALLGAKTPYIHKSYGSPKSATSLHIADTIVGATFISQTNHPNDPVANGLVNGDADYEVKFKPSAEKSVIKNIPILGDLITNHPFDNYLEDEKAIIKDQKNEK
ncbi:hemagglutinin repeat-containing protein, partial [Arcobacteraceae bacterium]|nr:hemagglutinin repeat-containing protein [Arcobacteraceae bacterium]